MVSQASFLVNGEKGAQIVVVEAIAVVGIQITSMAFRQMDTDMPMPTRHNMLPWQDLRRDPFLIMSGQQLKLKDHRTTLRA